MCNVSSYSLFMKLAPCRHKMNDNVQIAYYAVSKLFVVFYICTVLTSSTILAAFKRNMEWKENEEGGFASL